MNFATVLKIGFYGGLAYFVLGYVFNSVSPVVENEKEYARVAEVNKQQIANRAENLESALNMVDKLPMPDSNLRACIKKNLLFWEPKIKAGVMTDPRQITQLECRNKNIAQLNGLEQFKQLQKVDLSRNNIRDVSALQSITSIETLDLEGNPSVDTLWKITDLNNLRVLNLLGTQLENINILLSFKSLRKLSYRVSNNQKCDDLDRFFKKASEIRLRVNKPAKCIDQYGNTVRF